MNKNSSYNKIRTIIDTASSHNGTISTLSKAIYGNSDAFTYYKRDKNGNIQESPCSESSIKRQIRFCINLGLLVSEEQCSLTNIGVTARLNGRFDFQIQTAVNNFLQKNELPLAKIEEAVNYLDFPHADALYQYLTPSLSQDLFRTCLYLLSVCGADDDQNLLKSFGKKLYLSDKKIKHAQTQLEKKR